jgi:hypothetical protein
MIISGLYFYKFPVVWEGFWHCNLVYGFTNENLPPLSLWIYSPIMIYAERYIFVHIVFDIYSSNLCVGAIDSSNWAQF